MKNSKKMGTLFLIMTICISVFQGAYAVGEKSSSKSAIINLVEKYLESSANDSFMYQSNDLVSNTVDALTIQQKKDIALDSDILHQIKSILPSENNEPLIKDSSLKPYQNKTEYFKHVRQKQGISRRDFSVDYQFNKVDIQGTFAKATVSELISFYYSDCDEPTYIGTEYEVYLVNIEDHWYIYDMYSDDESDSLFKDENFNLDKALQEYDSISEYPTDGITQEVDGRICALQSNVTNYRAFNRESAARYAYTYTTGGSTNQTSYYNSLFNSYNADCQNFASQCVWAGFGGDNTSSSISGAVIPMDNVGTNRWYANPTATYWAWTACSYFRNYISSSSSSSDTRVFADIYDVAGNVNSFSGLPIYPVEMIGSVMHVYGSYGAYDHAIVITNVTGNTRNDVYFCAHTSHRKNAKLSDFWPAQSTDVDSGRIKVIVPTTSCEVVSCAGRSSHTYSSISAGNGTDSICNNCGYCPMYVACNWINPVSVNSSATLSATVSLNAYRIAMKVVAPNGTTAWLNQASNSSSISNSYTFTQTGLYTITVTARDTNDSISGSITRSGTYQVRVF